MRRLAAGLGTGGLIVGALVSPPSLPAQRVTAGGQLIGIWHALDRTPDGGPLREFRVVQPVVMLTARVSTALSLRATANLEGLTIPDGELLLGGWGEGFVDRRHPHTYVHELMVEAVTAIGCGGRQCQIGAFLGKGFVPFGSDDPMSRPFLRFPVNHHLAQILERAILGVQARHGALTVEGALFNGDEPERPGQWPRISSRFGDSWAARATLVPAAGLELSGSAARVRSPEHRPGAGPTQDKLHAGLRIDRAVGAGGIRGLAEWARTSELDGFFVFASLLVEAQWRQGRFTVQYRGEDTDRPEEERLERFRSARPHLENSILGITRWVTHTAGVSARLTPVAARGRLDGIVEITSGRVTARRAGAFDPQITYGGDRFWSASLGLRVSVNSTDHRMGRYALHGAHH